ncbi:MAG: asparaginase, partial [Anaerolineales bacterium]
MSMEDRKNPDALIVEVVRGRIVESRHQVSMAMVDVDGRLLLAFGEITQPQYLRSSAKPFQALPFIEGGFADQLDFTPRQIALVCAS